MEDKNGYKSVREEEDREKKDREINRQKDRERKKLCSGSV